MGEEDVCGHVFKYGLWVGIRLYDQGEFQGARSMRFLMHSSDLHLKASFTLLVQGRFAVEGLG